jgi:hypothetical protein
LVVTYKFGFGGHDVDLVLEIAAKVAVSGQAVGNICNRAQVKLTAPHAQLRVRDAARMVARESKVGYQCSESGFAQALFCITSVAANPYGLGIWRHLA